MCFINFNCNLFPHRLALILILLHSSSAGGGGGSGGSFRFSACTITAGSSAKIEAKGGTGGQARGSGKIFPILYKNITPHTYLHLHLHTGQGGGGGGGGVFVQEATTVNYDNGMTIAVNEGAGGSGSATWPTHVGLPGSAGKVFLISRLYYSSHTY